MRQASDTTTMDETQPAIEPDSLTERIVLLAIADAAVSDDTPVASMDIRPRCRDLLESVDTEVVSTPNESDIMRALSQLGTEPYVKEETSDTSPTGKGRPKYELGTDPETVLSAIAEDERLEGTVETVRSE